MIVDTHCHLNFPAFDADRDDVIARARKNGVKKMITIGCHPEDFSKTLQIAEKNEGVFAAIGIHPCDAENADFSEVEKMVSGKKIVALGETGFDFFHEKNPPQKVQEEVFLKHITLAKKEKKPVIVHLRNAEKAARNFLEYSFDFSFEVHCFCGDWDFARFLLDRGAMIGFGGIFSFKNCEDEMREVAKKCPINHILLETDSPFLSPHPHRGKRNEPAFTRNIAEFLAEIRGEDFEDFCAKTTRNAEQFFGIGEPSIYTNLL